MAKSMIERNMGFLVKELQKEWEVSKETKHTVTVTEEETEVICENIRVRTEDIAEILEKDEALSFQRSMEYSRENYIVLRLGRKLLAADRQAKKTGGEKRVIDLDREEFRLFRELHKS